MANKNKVIRKTIECIEYLSVEAPLRKVDYLEDKQSKYIHEYVKNKEYCIVGTMRRHGFSQRDVDRQWSVSVSMINCLFCGISIVTLAFNLSTTFLVST